MQSGRSVNTMSRNASGVLMIGQMLPRSAPDKGGQRALGIH